MQEDDPVVVPLFHRMSCSWSRNWDGTVRHHWRFHRKFEDLSGNWEDLTTTFYMKSKTWKKPLPTLQCASKITSVNLHIDGCTYIVSVTINLSINENQELFFRVYARLSTSLQSLQCNFSLSLFLSLAKNKFSTPKFNLGLGIPTIESWTLPQRNV